VNHGDEIGALAASFNHMRESIATREDQIMRLAYTDSLTGLPNRAKFGERMDLALAHAKRTRGTIAVLVMDLDRFKYINDTLGHPAGDKVLLEVARRLEALLRDTDIIARLGGDEFAALLPSSDTLRVTTLAQDILATLQTPVVLDDQVVDIGGSIGVASFPEHGTDPSTLLRCADVAMYKAKRANIGFAMYDQRYDRDNLQHLSLLGELRRAMAQGELCLYYQPKIAVSEPCMVGVEALIRWNHPQRGFLPPSEFIPFAEQTGAIRAITRWVIEAAVEQCGKWQREGMALSVSLNISARDLLDRELPEILQGVLRAQQVPPQRICLEITEGALMEDSPRSEDTLQRLHNLGVGLAVDDYGTGYSSLTYLKHLMVDELKIDRSFIMGMTESSEDAAIVRSTIELGHSLGLSVVAEGVQSDRILSMLRDLGCDQAQGFYVGVPFAAGHLKEWLKLSPWRAGLGPRATPKVRKLLAA
jgi:diguanylate cyclase (GGDEF)-like protein